MVETDLGCPAWRRAAAYGRETERNKLDDDAVGEFRSARRLRPGGATSKRVEDAASQPKGGGVARETRAGRATAGRESILEGVHPMIPALLTQTRPAAVIIAPLELLSGLSPGVLPHVRLAAVPSRLRLIEIQIARR
jgi:hypothetical protein